MDDVILHDQDCWATTNSAAALADAIEEISTRDLASIGAALSTLVSERYAWPRVFERLFSIYREVSAGYRRSAAG
jgi:glycosyltransferase involved in cell wall biosynthesis